MLLFLSLSMSCVGAPPPILMSVSHIFDTLRHNYRITSLQYKESVTAIACQLFVCPI